MGTRNLTAVYLDGEYKIAQYGQWDGYPDGQGKKVLGFARKLADPETRAKFEENLRACSWATKEYIDKIDAEIKAKKVKNWTLVYPELSRDTCAGILQMVLVRGGLVLGNNIEFAADGVLCEWAWVIDLDKNTFEGFAGFNKTPLTPDDRFYFLREKEECGYHGVVLAASWDLAGLPSDEDFLAAFKDAEE